MKPIVSRKKYKIEDLLLLCNEDNMTLSVEDKAWLNMPSIGRELFDE